MIQNYNSSSGKNYFNHYQYALDSRVRLYFVGPQCLCRGPAPGSQCPGPQCHSTKNCSVHWSREGGLNGNSMSGTYNDNEIEQKNEGWIIPDVDCMQMDIWHCTMCRTQREAKDEGSHGSSLTSLGSSLTSFVGLLPGWVFVLGWFQKANLLFLLCRGFFPLELFRRSLLFRLVFRHLSTEHLSALNYAMLK